MSIIDIIYKNLDPFCSWLIMYTHRVLADKSIKLNAYFLFERYVVFAATILYILYKPYKPRKQHHEI